MQTDIDAWTGVDAQDRWVFNKLEVALRQGLCAAPSGVGVSYSGWYVVRPTYNLEGMSKDARVEWIEAKNSGGRGPGEFWCEYLQGCHLSCDYSDRQAQLCVFGSKEPGSLWRFRHWKRLPARVAPDIEWVLDLSERYYVNVEMIGDYVIEVHLRPDPCFYGNSFTELIPVWDDEPVESPGREWVFFDKPDYTLDVKRLGFWAR
jgi:hypothetical protein